MKTEKELKEDIEKCDNAKDGYLGFSKENWDLRGHYAKAQLKTLQERDTEVKQAINEEIGKLEKGRTKLHKKYSAAKLTPRLDAGITTLNELLQKLGLGK